MSAQPEEGGKRRNLFLDDLEEVERADLENFLRLDQPDETQRPVEGPRLDFKSDVPDDIGDDVAGLANTYGGLILIGVKSDKEKHNIPLELVGVHVGHGDWIARITQKVLSTVQPRPPFDVTVVPSGKRDCAVILIRVYEGDHPPYEFTKGPRISVRFQDTTRQATAREIENLFAKRDRAKTSPEEIISEYLPAKGSYYKNRPDPCKYLPDPGQILFVVPRGELRIPIDAAVEHKFETEVRSHFPDESKPESFRRGRFFLLVSGDALYRRTWEVWSSGAVGFAGSFRREMVSLGNIVLDFLRASRLARRLLANYGYMGHVVLTHEMRGGNGRILSHFPQFENQPPENLEDIPSSKQSDPKDAQIVKELEWAELDDPAPMVAETLLEELREIRGAKLSLDWLRENTQKIARTLKKDD